MGLPKITIENRIYEKGKEKIKPHKFEKENEGLKYTLSNKIFKIDSKLSGGDKNLEGVFIKNVNNYIREKYNAEFKVVNVKGKKELVLVINDKKSEKILGKLDDLLKMNDEAVFLDKNNNGIKEKNEEGIVIESYTDEERNFAEQFKKDKELKDFILRKSEFFKFNDLKIVKKAFPDITVQDVKDILNINPNFYFPVLKNFTKIFPKSSIQDIKDILELNKSFNFNEIKSIKKLFSSLTLKDVKDILEINKHFRFYYYTFKRVKKAFPELTIQDVKYILDINPYFDFDKLEKLKKNFSDITIENVKYFIKKQKKYFSISDLVNTKKAFPKISIDHLKIIIETNPKFKLSNLMYFQEAFPNVKIEKLLNIIKNNPQIDLFNLSLLGFWEKNVDEAISYYENILKLNKDFHFFGLEEFRKTFKNITINKLLDIITNHPKIDLYDLSQIGIFENNLDKAISYYVKIVKLNKDFDFLGLEDFHKRFPKIKINKLFEIIRKNPKTDFLKLSLLGIYEKNVGKAVSYYENIVSLNKNFKFYDLEDFHKEFPNITINKLFEIIRKYPQIDLSKFQKILAYETDIDKALGYYKKLIIKYYKNFDFLENTTIIFLKASIQDVIDILNINQGINFKVFRNILETFPDFRIQDVKDILKVNRNFDFMDLRYIRYLDKKPTKKELLEIIQKNPNINFNYLNIIPSSLYLCKDFENFKQFKKDFFKVITTNKEIGKKGIKIKLLKQFRKYFKDEKSFKKFTNLIINHNIINYLSRKSQSKKEDILKDPAVENFIKIEKMGEFDSFDIETKMILARNLYFKNKKVNKENIQNEYTNLLEKRKKYKNMTLFKGRNIVYTAHHEDLDKTFQNKKIGKERFGKKATIEAIKKQGGNITKLIHPENKIEEIKKAKQDTLKALENTSSPMTFVFDGHGGPDAIYLSDGDFIDGNNIKVKEKKNTIKITVDEIANTLIKRAQNQKIDHNEKDILIFESCYNHTFMRKLYDKLREYNQNNQNKVNLPITIGMSEYNQLGQSNFESKYGDDFNEKVLKLGDPNTTTTIGTILKNQKELKLSNPSIYIPDDNNIQMQIGKNNIGEKYKVA